jgi:putative ABC transport system permease protein
MGFASWRQDLCHSLRYLRRNAGFSTTVALTFGLGAGAATAIFTVVSGVLLRPLPFADPGRLVSIALSYDNKPANVFIGSPEVVEWQKSSRTMAGVAGYFRCAVNLESAAVTERIECANVTASLLPTLGIQPARGRNFLPEEDRPGGPPAVLVSHRFWKQRGVDVGQFVRLDGQNRRVVGVLPENFRIPLEYKTEQELWLPFQLQEGRANLKMLWAVGRLGPRAGLEGAQSEFDALLRAMPVKRRSVPRVVLTPWQERVTGKVRSTLLLFLAAVGFVLLIACVNVANLLLTKSTGRRKEIAVRRAMGASASRIVRQLLTESVLLALCGAAAGLAVAYATRSLLVAFIALALPTVPEIPLDARVLAFAVGLATVCGIGFGLAPALLSARVPVNECLNASGRAGGAARERLRDLLVVGEVALATYLMIGAGLLFTNFVRLRGIDPGMPADRILMWYVELKGAAYRNPEAQSAYFRDALDRLREVPGVEAASVSLDGGISGAVDGREYMAEWAAVSADYFRLMNDPLLHGRTFGPSDDRAVPAVVVVDQSFARKYCPASDCANVRPTVGRIGAAEIVGVVGDHRQWGDWPANPTVFTHYLQMPEAMQKLLVRTSAPPKTLIPAIRNALARVDRTQAPGRFQTLEEEIAGIIAPRRVNTLLLVAFAALATLLGAAGIYSVMAHAVARRTHEIGVRVALGAGRGDIRAMVIRRGLWLVAIGEVAGIAGALGLNRVIAGLLFQMRPTEPPTYVAVAVLWLLLGTLACYAPARRAMAVQPADALRYE